MVSLRRTAIDAEITQANGKTPKRDWKSRSLAAWKAPATFAYSIPGRCLLARPPTPKRFRHTAGVSRDLASSNWVTMPAIDRTELIGQRSQRFFTADKISLFRPLFADAPTFILFDSKPNTGSG